MKIKIVSEFEIEDLDTFDKTNAYDTLCRLKQDCLERLLDYKNNHNDGSLTSNAIIKMYEQELTFSRRFTKNLKVEIEE